MMLNLTEKQRYCLLVMRGVQRPELLIDQYRGPKLVVREDEMSYGFVCEYSQSQHGNRTVRQVSRFQRRTQTTPDTHVRAYP